jgi:hypothetical protein
MKRPKKARTAAGREFVIAMRVNGEELDRIEAAARAAGLRTADWVRSTCLRAAPEASDRRR